MPESMTAQTIAENQRNMLSVALLNSERNVALLNQALAAANARIAEYERIAESKTAECGVEIPDHLKVVGSATFDTELKVNDSHP